MNLLFVDSPTPDLPIPDEYQYGSENFSDDLKQGNYQIIDFF